MWPKAPRYLFLLSERKSQPENMKKNVFGGVAGNPITQNIVDSGSGVTVHGDGLSKAEVGRKAHFYVDSKGHRGEITHYQVDGKLPPKFAISSGFQVQAYSI